MGKNISRLYYRTFKRRKIYVTTQNENDDEEEDEEENENESENDDNLPPIPFYKPDEYEEIANKFVFVKGRVQQHLDFVKKQAQQAIIDATVVTTRKNTYGNKIAKTDMVPNRYILKSMLSRSSQEQQELFVKRNEDEILSQVALLQTIQGYHRDEFVDDHMILHEHEAYLSTMNYLLVSPTTNQFETDSRRDSIGNTTITF